MLLSMNLKYELIILVCLPDLYLFEEEVSAWGLEILPGEHKTFY